MNKIKTNLRSYRYQLSTCMDNSSRTIISVMQSMKQGLYFTNVYSGNFQETQTSPPTLFHRLGWIYKMLYHKFSLKSRLVRWKSPHHGWITASTSVFVKCLVRHSGQSVDTTSFVFFLPNRLTVAAYRGFLINTFPYC